MVYLISTLQLNTIGEIVYKEVYYYHDKVYILKEYNFSRVFYNHNVNYDAHYTHYSLFVKVLSVVSAYCHYNFLILLIDVVTSFCHGFVSMFMQYRHVFVTDLIVDYLCSIVVQAKEIFQSQSLFLYHDLFTAYFSNLFDSS